MDILKRVKTAYPNHEIVTKYRGKLGGETVYAFEMTSDEKSAFVVGFDDGVIQEVTGPIVMSLKNSLDVII